MKLSDEERYRILTHKELYLKLPVAFIHPINSAPGEPEFEASIRNYRKMCELNRSGKCDLLAYLHGFPLSGKLYREFNGRHTWRSAYDGEELISLEIGEAVWSGWVLRPAWEIWQRDFQAPDHYADDRICIAGWVLVDDITGEQYDAWETFRRTCNARRKMEMEDLDQVQMELF